MMTPMDVGEKTSNTPLLWSGELGPALQLQVLDTINIEITVGLMPGIELEVVLLIIGTINHQTIQPSNLVYFNF